jgi:hypothetical protein
MVPRQTTYTCEPVPTGTDGCIGGPKWFERQNPDGPIHQDDPDKTFPLECYADIPDCSGFFRGALRRFHCGPSGMGPEWAELL